MRTSQYLLFTLKEIPHDTVITSHKLMLRSGMIRQLSTGLYMWLPTGLRILKKVQNIINKEMQKINAFEMSMPIMQPDYLWKESGRLTTYGDELFKCIDRRENCFILGPTHEEIITNFIRNEIHTYKSLPFIIYQTQIKLRDEIRPRFGIMRAREFLMKDAYSFHTNQQCLEKTYNIMSQSYCNIFKKIKIDFRVVKADSGSMGGHISHEFQALSDNGEDEIVFSNDSDYATNINMVKSTEKINLFQNKPSIENISDETQKTQRVMINNKLNIPIEKQIKTILVKTKCNEKHKMAALLIRSDHDLNTYKIENIDIFEKPVIFINEKEIISRLGVKKQFLGPLGLKIPIIADISVAKMKNFSIGANVENHFFTNVNWNIDLPMPIIKDIRKVTSYDLRTGGKGFLNIKKSIEIGHIFQLGKKYSHAMNAVFKDQYGDKKNIYMGCYGIGITRMIATIIEQNHDSDGIIWPHTIAPFELAILPINLKNNIYVQNMSEKLYKIFIEKDIEVLLDDRNEQPGIMFNEIDLIGIPHQIIISPRGMNNNHIEYRQRKNKKSLLIPMNEIVDFIIKKLK